MGAIKSLGEVALTRLTWNKRLYVTQKEAIKLQRKHLF
jgi:hypothetical protein